MADDLPPDLDIYAFLSISEGASDSEIRRAYRAKSLLYHPDKNPDPSAVQKFHHLKLALDILESPSARAAYDNLRKAKAAKAARTSKYDDERRRMQRDLESRERDAKRRKVERANGVSAMEEEEQVIREAVQKLKEESERLKRERDQRILKKIEEEQMENELEDEGRRTVKVRFRKGLDRRPISTEVVGNMFLRFGRVENVILGKSALVVFERASEAKAAVAGTQSGDPALKMVKEIMIVQGSNKDPPLSESTKTEQAEETKSTPTPVTVKPHVVSSAPKFSFKPSMGNGNGADYESITLMRMRKIEKERLEREIHEQEEKEDLLAI